MTRGQIRTGVISTLLVGAVIASCGGSDGDSETGEAPDAAPTATTATDETSDVGADEPTRDEVTDDQATDDEVTDDGVDEESEPSVDDSEGDSEGGDTSNCDGIFRMAEAEEFLAEPVELTEETNDSLGQLTCNWESIEVPDDMEDLGAQTLFVQFYSGSPIEGSAFIDPTIFDSVTAIDGVGDLAYTPDATPSDYYFVDGEVAGSLSYFEFDLGDTEAEPLHTTDDVEQLFRTFHERVT